MPPVPATTLEGIVGSLGSAAVWALAVVLWRPRIQRFGADATNFCKCAVAATAFVLLILATDGGASLAALTELDGHRAWTLGVSAFLGMTLGDSLLFLSAQRLGAHQALMYLNLIPLVTTLLDALLTGVRLEAMALAGILVTVAGVTLVVLRPRTAAILRDGEPRRDRAGHLAALGSVLANSFGILWRKPALEVCDPVPVAAVQLAIGALGVALLAPMFGRGRRLLTPLRARGQRLPVLALSLLGTVFGYWLFLLGIRGNAAGAAASLGAMTPVFALPILWLLYRERPSAPALWGTLLSLVGVALLVR